MPPGLRINVLRGSVFSRLTHRTSLRAELSVSFDFVLNQPVDMLSAPMSDVQRAMSEASRLKADGTAISNRFVNDLRFGRWHEAYQATTRRFRQTMHEASLERFVQESPPLDDPVAPVQFIVAIPSGTSGKVDAWGSSPKDGAWVSLVSEHGTLNVDRIAIGDRLTP